LHFLIGEHDFEMANGTFHISLSLKGLSNIPDHQEMRDFRFIAGHHRHLCSQFVASFLSPRIGRLLMFDCSVMEYCLGFSDSGCCFDFSFSLSGGLEIDFREKAAHFLFPFAKPLAIESSLPD
jgi:hypothetical protein